MEACFLDVFLWEEAYQLDLHVALSADEDFYVVPGLKRLSRVN
jgi:hypothetical protein